MLKPEDLHEPSLLTQGPGTQVYQALSPDGEAVILKRFALSRAPDWKAQELFLREAQVLQQLAQPGLPRMLAWGQAESEAWLIYTWIPGQSLADKLAAGWRPETEQVLDLGRQLLELLAWLHGHAPPLVHRDVKPSNLILDPEGKLHLIDFGAVLLHLRPEGGSTVAGTFGYMAPEQLSGRAGPGSDLYAAGATLIHLLTGLPPAELPQERLRIRFEEHVECPAALKAWLRSLIEPQPEDRCRDAATALRSLEQARQGQLMQVPRARQPAPAADMAAQPAPPRHMRAIEVHESPERLELLLPPRSLHGSSLKLYVTANTVGSAYSLVMTAQIFQQLGHLAPALQLPALILLLGLIGFGALFENRRMQRLTGSQTRLHVDGEGLEIEERREGYSLSQRKVPWQAIESVLPSGQLQRQGWAHLRLNWREQGRRRSLRLGQMLEPEEVAWLNGRLIAAREHFAPQAAEDPPEAE